MLPEQLSDLEGILLLSLYDASLSPVGTISCEKLEQIENEHIKLCFHPVDYVVILPCAALDGYTQGDPWRQRFWTELRQPMMFGHRGNGMTYKTDPLVH